MSEYKDFLASNNLKAIEAALTLSEIKLDNLRNNIKDIFNDKQVFSEICIVTTGSYARREASEESDLDYFLIIPDSLDKDFVIDNLSEIIEQKINSLIPKPAGSTNTFGAEAIVHQRDLLRLNHNDEHNKDLTRRMLLLLEGDYLYNLDKFEEIRQKIIEEYIKHNEVKFLINDIARYYRTMLTDFHYKINTDKKTWGVRSIKLKFSRKIIYLSGLLAVSLMNQDEVYTMNTSKVQDILKKDPLNRIYTILNFTKEFDEKLLLDIFSSYNFFLEKISNKQNRKNLDGVERNLRQQDPLYTELNSRGESFKDSCYQILERVYDCKVNPMLDFKYLVI